jgi:adenine-specific DNA-methyltransferase
MYPRLKLLRELLSDDGAIFVSIDDNEHANLKLILDEIFDARNFVATIVWQKKYTQSNDAKYFSSTHDFILCYARNINSNFKISMLSRTDKQNSRYKNPDNDPKGLWMTQPLHAKSGNDTKYTYTFKNGVTWKPPSGTFPRFNPKTLKKAEEENRMWFGSHGTAVPRLKKYLNEMKEGIIPKTIWMYDEVGSNDEAKRELKELLPNNEFPSPKPTRLIKRIVELVCDKDSIILDSFAGSGTTAHAVLDLNKNNSGKRKFIIVELEDKIAKEITVKRVKRAIKKYGYDGGFEFCELDKPLFDENGQIQGECSFEQLATYILFTETQTNLERKDISGNTIGEYNDVTYYLIFKEKNENVLDKKFLSKIKNKKKKIVYADKCLIDEDTLEKWNIQFKQIPYEVKVY